MRLSVRRWSGWWARVAVRAVGPGSRSRRWPGWRARVGGVPGVGSQAVVPGSWAQAAARDAVPVDRAGLTRAAVVAAVAVGRDAAADSAAHGAIAAAGVFEPRRRSRHEGGPKRDAKGWPVAEPVASDAIPSAAPPAAAETKTDRSDSKPPESGGNVDK